MERKQLQYLLVIIVLATGIFFFVHQRSKALNNSHEIDLPAVPQEQIATSTQDQIGQFLATSSKKNLILISIDSLRADHMSLYGYDRKTTPTIDEWAKDAVVFENYFSTSFLTPISEASVHTGRYPFSNGVINFQAELKKDVPTIAQILQKRGWRTAAFSSSPEFTQYPAIRSSFSRGFDSYPSNKGSNPVEFSGRGGDPVPVSISWLSETRETQKPFFLWLSLGSVHWPYGQYEQRHFGDMSYESKLGNIGAKGWDLYGFIYKNKKYSYGPESSGAMFETDITQDDIDYVVGRYDDGILRTDRMLAKLFDYLKKNNLEKDTIIVLQSEHGEGFGERGYILHYDIFDEQIHTPLIVKAPGLSAQRVTTLVSGVDVQPTILGLLNIPVGASDGFNCMPFLNGVEGAPRSNVYITRTSLWERVMKFLDYKELNGFLDADDEEHFYDGAIRTTKWKLIHRLSRAAQEKWSWLGSLSNEIMILPEYELYDLEKDRGERSNVYEKYKNDNEIVYLRTKLDVWEARNKSMAPSATPAQPIQPYF